MNIGMKILELREWLHQSMGTGGGKGSRDALPGIDLVTHVVSGADHAN